MSLIFEKKYPPYYTYFGVAYKGRIEWSSISFLNLDWLVREVIEWNVEAKGGEMIYIKVWDKGQTQTMEYGLVNNYETEFVFKPKQQLSTKELYFFPWGVVIVLILIAIIAIAVYYALKESKQIIWGGPTPIIPYALLALGIGIATFGIGFAITRTKEATK